jgi:hypothetical protein
MSTELNHAGSRQVAYMGDYDAVATDRTQSSAGFVISWGDNSKGDANVVRGRTYGSDCDSHRGHH